MYSFLLASTTGLPGSGMYSGSAKCPEKSTTQGLKRGIIVKGVGKHTRLVVEQPVSAKIAGRSSSHGQQPRERALGNICQIP